MQQWMLKASVDSFPSRDFTMADMILPTLLGVICPLASTFWLLCQ